MTYKQFRAFHLALEHVDNNSKPFSHESTQNHSQPSTRFSPVAKDPKNIAYESNSRKRTSFQSLAKNRQAIAYGFNHRDKKNPGSPSSGLPLRDVGKKLGVVHEQEIPENEEVQLIHSSLSSNANEYFYSSMRRQSGTSEEAF